MSLWIWIAIGFTVVVVIVTIGTWSLCRIAAQGDLAQVDECDERHKP